MGAKFYPISLLTPALATLIATSAGAIPAQSISDSPSYTTGNSAIPPTAIAPANQVAANDVFAASRAQIQQSLPLGWMVRLPSQIAIELPSGQPTHYTFRVISSFSPRVLVSVFSCAMANASCVVGHFAIDRNTSPTAQQVLKHHQLAGSPVTLSRGVQAFVLVGTEQAQSSVVWEQDNLIYTISSPTQNRQSLIRTAYLTANATPISSNPTELETTVTERFGQPSSASAQVAESVPTSPSSIQISKTPASSVFPERSIPDLAGETAARDVTPQADEPDLAQVTAVSQLTDVQVTDWAFQALQSLVERYGVIEGYPERTFRGDRALTRYEFAAGLNAVMQKIDELRQSGTSDRIPQADLIRLNKLQEEFTSELTALRARADGLETKTAQLETQPFSTTVKLLGESIFGLVAAGGGNPPGRGQNNPILANQTQLEIVGSFTGRDLLRVGLSAGNFAEGGFAQERALNTYMSLLAYQSDSGNQLALSTLEYRFAVGDRAVVIIKPKGFSLSTVLSPNSDYTSAGQGAISRFGAESPLFKLGGLDAGVGVDWLLANSVRLQLAYGTRTAENPDQGIFNSAHQALGVQLLAKPGADVIVGLAYINAYAEDGRLDTFTGSFNADTSGGFSEPARIHAVNGTLRWRIAEDVSFGATGGVIYTDSYASQAKTLTTTYLLSLGFSKPFGRAGDLLGILVGQPPKLNFGINIERYDTGHSMHYELFYRFQVSDRISITPGFFIVTEPGHIESNNTIFVGTVRTTFRF